MNTLKRTVFIFLILATSISIKSQDKPYSLTVNGGVNLPSMRIKGANTDTKVGFVGGVGLEYNLPNNLFLQTGLSFSSKKVTSSFKAQGDINGDGISGDYMQYEGKIGMTYLSLPIKLGYRIPINNDARLNLSFGPYLSYGLGGETKEIAAGVNMTPEEVLGRAYYTESINKTFADNMLKRLDMGLAIGVRGEYKNFLLNVGYEYGLKNLSRSENSAYNDCFTITVGYRIF